MWSWFHPGWLLVIVPLLMMLICVLVCVFGGRMCRSCWSGCCRGVRNDGPS